MELSDRMVAESPTRKRPQLIAVIHHASCLPVLRSLNLTILDNV